MTTSPYYSPNSAMGSLLDPHMQAQMRRHQAMMNTPQVIPTHSPSDIGHPYLTAKAMICMRLQIAEGEISPFDFMECYVGKEEVIVFLVVNGQPVTLSDEKTLFPTDQLITKLNLLRK